MEGPVLVLSHEEWSPGEWGLYCYALLFSTTQHLFFNIPFNIFLLIFSAPFFTFSVSDSRDQDSIATLYDFQQLSTIFYIVVFFLCLWGGYAFQVCAFFVYNRIGIYVAKNRSMGPKKSVQQTFRGTRHAFHRGATAAFPIWAIIGLWPWTASVSNTSDLSYPPPPPSQFTDTHCSELKQLNIDSL